jgi:hypothetical protein
MGAREQIRTGNRHPADCGGEQVVDERRQQPAWHGYHRDRMLLRVHVTFSRDEDKQGGQAPAEHGACCVGDQIVNIECPVGAAIQTPDSGPLREFERKRQSERDSRG